MAELKDPLPPTRDDRHIRPQAPQIVLGYHNLWLLGADFAILLSIIASALVFRQAQEVSGTTAMVVRKLQGGIK
jgi:hypothetical protein